jgi:hypothetical protein
MSQVQPQWENLSRREMCTSQLVDGCFVNDQETQRHTLGEDGTQEHDTTPRISNSQHAPDMTVVCTKPVRWCLRQKPKKQKTAQRRTYRTGLSGIHRVRAEVQAPDGHCSPSRGPDSRSSAREQRTNRFEVKNLAKSTPLSTKIDTDGHKEVGRLSLGDHCPRLS